MLPGVESHSTLYEKSGDPHSQKDPSLGNHEHLSQISKESIQYFLR